MTEKPRPLHPSELFRQLIEDCPQGQREFVALQTCLLDCLSQVVAHTLDTGSEDLDDPDVILESVLDDLTSHTLAANELDFIHRVHLFAPNAPADADLPKGAERQQREVARYQWALLKEFTVSLACYYCWRAARTNEERIAASKRLIASMQRPLIASARRQFQSSRSESPDQHDDLIDEAFRRLVEPIADRNDDYETRAEHGALVNVWQNADSQTALGAYAEALAYARDAISNNMRTILQAGWSQKRLASEEWDNKKRAYLFDEHESATSESLKLGQTCEEDRVSGALADRLWRVACEAATKYERENCPQEPCWLLLGGVTYDGRRPRPWREVPWHPEGEFLKKCFLRNDGQPLDIRGDLKGPLHTAMISAGLLPLLIRTFFAATAQHEASPKPLKQVAGGGGHYDESVDGELEQAHSVEDFLAWARKHGFPVGFGPASRKNDRLSTVGFDCFLLAGKETAHAIVANELNGELSKPAPLALGSLSPTRGEAANWAKGYCGRL